MYSTLYCSRWAASSRATIKAVCHQWVLKYRECFWLTLSVNMEGRRDGNASYASHSQHSGPLRQRHQRRGPCWRLAVAATPAADPAATCRWLLVLQRAFSPPSSNSQNVPAMFMSHSLHLFYSYGFAVEFIDDCFSLCSNLVSSMKDSMSKFCLALLVGLMSFSFPVSLCTDQDSPILLYFHLNLTRKSDLFLVCSTVIFPILYSI